VQEALQVRIAAQLQEVGLIVKVVEILITDSLSKGNNSRGSKTIFTNRGGDLED
jgi:hypothetical protein